MSWGKGPNYSQKNAAVGFGDLFEGEEQSGLEFASAGHKLAKACTVFHGFWKHRLQFSIIMQQEKKHRLCDLRDASLGYFLL